MKSYRFLLLKTNIEEEREAERKEYNNLCETRYKTFELDKTKMFILCANLNHAACFNLASASLLDLSI